MVQGSNPERERTLNPEPGIRQVLEGEARRYLHDARIARQARDRAERRGVADIAVRQAEIDRVEYVEDVPAERRREALTETDVPLEREIEVLEPRPGEAIAQLVAERAGRHRLKRRQVEPLIHRLRTLRIADDVRQTRHVRSHVVAALIHREGASGALGVNP